MFSSDMCDEKKGRNAPLNGQRYNLSAKLEHHWRSIIYLQDGADHTHQAVLSCNIQRQFKLERDAIA
jgi:hypothetical protein